MIKVLFFAVAATFFNHTLPISKVSTTVDGVTVNYAASGSVTITQDSLFINVPPLMEAYKIESKRKFSNNTQYTLDGGSIANLYSRVLLLNKNPKGKQIKYDRYEFCKDLAAL